MTQQTFHFILFVCLCPSCHVNSQIWHVSIEFCKHRSHRHARNNKTLCSVINRAALQFFILTGDKLYKQFLRAQNRWVELVREN